MNAIETLRTAHLAAGPTNCGEMAFVGQPAQHRTPVLVRIATHQGPLDARRDPWRAAVRSYR